MIVTLCICCAIHLPFFSSLISCISCKYHRIQHLQRVRLSSTINHTHPPPQVHRGGGVQTMTTMLEHMIYISYNVLLHMHGCWNMNRSSLRLTDKLRAGLSLGPSDRGGLLHPSAGAEEWAPGVPQRESPTRTVLVVQRQESRLKSHLPHN